MSCLIALGSLSVTGGCVSTEPAPSWNRPEIRTAVSDAVDRPSDGQTLGPLVWGLGPRPNPQAQAAALVQDPPQDPAQETDAEREARLRARFGSTVLINADGRVTKRYFLAHDLGPVFLKLVNPITEAPLDPAQIKGIPSQVVGAADDQSILGRMLGGKEIEIAYMPQFEKLTGAELIDAKGRLLASSGKPPLIAPTGAPDVALLLVTAKPSSLAAFEDALNLFYEAIPQVEITVQVIEYGKAGALAFGIQFDENAPPMFANMNSSQLVQAYTSVFPLNQPIVGGNPVTDRGLFTLGGIHDSWEFNAVIQALESNNLADITSSPKLVVRNGGIASISTITEIPYPKAKIFTTGTNVTSDINFKPVGVQMSIVPVIAGTDSVILQVYADVSQVTGFADTDPVVTPIISTREAVTTVHLKNNHSLVIGGLTSVSEFESETKVPILGDIPIIGVLFRSTTRSTQETEVAFQITPRIVKERGLPLDQTGF